MQGKIPRSRVDSASRALKAAASRQKEGAEKMPHVSSRELLDMSGVQKCVGN